MPMLLFHHIAGAYEALRSNRMRTVLTVLGVMIGVASIVVILSLSAGAARIISEQIDDHGGTVAVVRPGSADRQPKLNDLTAALGGKRTASNLTEQDLIDIQTIQGVTAAAPLMMLGGDVTAGDKTPHDVALLATTPALPKVTNLAMDEGQFIDTVTNADTAVIGSQLSIDLFGTEQSVGRTFRTYGKTFTVIGILKRTNNPINYSNVDFDHAAIINLESGKLLNQNVAAIQQITIQAENAAMLPAVIDEVTRQLTSNHFGEKDFVVLAGDDLSRPSNELFYAIGATLTTVAAVSLVVGGIGIMNILLVSVTERTREIGIRKALGASNSHITWQFLIESLAMSMAGGVFGYIVGYVFAFTLSRMFLTFDPVFSWQIAGAAIAISLGVGLLFGLYPAIRAARKNPIEALRNYH